jgi:hypothetical protein
MLRGSQGNYRVLDCATCYAKSGQPLGHALPRWHPAPYEGSTPARVDEAEDNVVIDLRRALRDKHTRKPPAAVVLSASVPTPTSGRRG